MSIEGKDIEEKKKRLQDLLKPDTEPRQKFEGLQQLAREVGASTIRLYPGHGEAELLANIQMGLQTETMLAMCQDASRKTTIAIIAAVASVFSALAAFGSVLCGG